MLNIGASKTYQESLAVVDAAMQTKITHDHFSYTFKPGLKFTRLLFHRGDLIL